MQKTVLFFIFLLIGSTIVYSQTNKKLIVLVTRANWCPTCRANDGKIKNELIPLYISSENVSVVINDVTNKRSKARSRSELMSAGVYEISLKEYSTGAIALIDPRSGLILNRLSVSNSFETMKKVISETASKLSN